MKGGDIMEPIKETVKKPAEKIVERTVATFKVEDIKAGKVDVPSRSNGGAIGAASVIRSKAAEVLKASGDAVLLGELVRHVHGESGTNKIEEKGYRQCYMYTRTTLEAKSSGFLVKKYDVEGKACLFVVKK